MNNINSIESEEENKNTTVSKDKFASISSLHNICIKLQDSGMLTPWFVLVVMAGRLHQGKEYGAREARGAVLNTGHLPSRTPLPQTLHHENWVLLVQ